MRVVSLLPSATEIVYALGVEPVATSHECDWPPEAEALPAVNTSAVDPEASSADINDQVTDAEGNGGVYTIDDEALLAADPDLVISQGVCDVCAVDSTLVRDAIDRLGLDCDLLTTHPHSLADVLDDVERIGRALGREERAREVRGDLEDRVDRVRERAPDATTEGDPCVAVLDWLYPPMVAGHWIPGMVEIAGGRYDMQEPGTHSEPTDWQAILDYDPEVLVLAPCGFDMDHVLREVDEVTDREGFDDLAAVANDRVYAMDGHHYVNRPGPRLVDTLEFLAWCLSPDRFERPPRDAVRPLASAVQ